MLLAGGTIYISPTDEPIQNGVVLIDGQKIVAVGTRVDIPEGSEVIDCTGLTITAGFWNSHVHFMERKWADAANIPAPELTQQLQDMLTRYGFTSAFDLSSIWENTRVIRDRIESGEVQGPTIYSTGPGLLPANPGIPPGAARFMGWMDTDTPVHEIADAAQAEAIAQTLLDSGVDAIKLFMSAPSKSRLPQSVIDGAVRAAHQRRKLVFAHPNSGADVLAAVQGGVDVIAHTTPHAGLWDEALLTTMREHNVALTPTLWIWKWYARHDRQSAQDKVVSAEVGQLRAWVARGGTVLFGTDLGAVDPDPTEEYELMSQAGMSFREILASLTTAPAVRFGKSKELGRVVQGFRADLAVFKHGFWDVRYTLRDGKVIYSPPFQGGVPERSNR
jgi:imidazolonepropionase-like amidohydrolase